jgi:hypothetical protein
MSSYTASISISQLPHLFQDAIAITQSLGLKYIWIDCLCIVQDSAQDWETEAASMASIYENAAFTIAATNNEGCEESLFQHLQPPPHPGQITESEGKAIWLRRRPQHPFSVSQRGYERAGETSADWIDFPLLSRGWVYQEHLLSKRYVYFGKKELAFECREAIWCECQSQTIRNTETLRKMPLADRLRDWTKVIEQYMRLELTYETDRLPAIAGVAELYQRLYGGSYIAGHWFEDMKRQLCWFQQQRARTDVDSPRRPNANKVPTWSWVAATELLEWDIATEDQLEFLTFQREPRSSPYMAGPVELTIRGPILSATVHHDEEWWSLTHARMGQGPKDEPRTRFGLGIKACDAICEFYADDRTEQGPVPATTSGFPVTLLICGESSGLVLRLLDEAHQLYQRIGYFRGTIRLKNGNALKHPGLSRLSTVRTITLI